MTRSDDSNYNFNMSFWRVYLILKIVLAKQLDVIPSIVHVVKPFSDTVCQNLSVQKENDKPKSINYENFQMIDTATKTVKISIEII